MLRFVVGLSAFVSAIRAAPSPGKDIRSSLDVSSPAKLLGKRDPCNGVDATYQLYKTYDQNDCPAPNPSNYGDCFPLNGLDPVSGLPCNLFCQQEVTYTYGQEQILPLSICHHPFTCTITQTITKTTQHQITLNLNGGINASALKAFTLGASYNYNWNRAETNTQSLAVTPKEGECGYFSFLPHLVTTCGLVADAPDNSDEKCPQPKQHYNKVDYGCESDFAEIKTASGDTRHQGATVFVYVDCATNAPLPCGDGTKQDEAYCKPGVALPRSVLLQQLSAMPSATPDVGKCDGGGGFDDHKRGGYDRGAEFYVDWAAGDGYGDEYFSCGDGECEGEVRGWDD